MRNFMIFLIFFPIATFGDTETVADYHKRLVEASKYLHKESQTAEFRNMNIRALELANEQLAISQDMCSDPKSKLAEIKARKVEIVKIADEMDKSGISRYKKAINQVRIGSVLMAFKAKRIHHRCLGIPIR